MTSNARVAQSLRDRKNRFRTRVRHLRRLKRYHSFRVSMTTCGSSTIATLQAMIWEHANGQWSFRWRDVRPLPVQAKNGGSEVEIAPTLIGFVPSIRLAEAPTIVIDAIEQGFMKER